MENAVICPEMVFFLCSLALHEFPDDIFTNEDRRQGAVVLHVLCVSTPLVALLACPEGRPGWWWVGSKVPTEASPLLSVHTPSGGPLSPVGGRSLNAPSLRGHRFISWQVSVCILSLISVPKA